jgi:hypothetical protein
MKHLGRSLGTCRTKELLFHRQGRWSLGGGVPAPRISEKVKKEDEKAERG